MQFFLADETSEISWVVYVIPVTLTLDELKFSESVLSRDY